MYQGRLDGFGSAIGIAPSATAFRAERGRRRMGPRRPLSTAGVVCLAHGRPDPTADRPAQFLAFSRFNLGVPFGNHPYAWFNNII